MRKSLFRAAERAFLCRGRVFFEWQNVLFHITEVRVLSWKFHWIAVRTASGDVREAFLLCREAVAVGFPFLLCENILSIFFTPGSA
jgi:hypothetical protein